MIRESISFARLDDETWGVRFASKAQAPAPGSQVQVSKRDGTTQTVTLGAVVSRDAGAFPGPATYYRVAGRNGNGGKAPQQQAPTAQTRVMRPLASGAYAVLINGDTVGHVLPAVNGWWSVPLSGQPITHHNDPQSAATALCG